MKKKIILVGNAITAEIIYDYLIEDERYSVCAVTVEDDFINDVTFKNLPVIPLSKLESYFDSTQVNLIMAVGYHDLNKTRARLFNELRKRNFVFETYIHPHVKIFKSNKIGEASIILPSAVIEPFVKIGENTVIWSSVNIAHHSIIGNNCWLATGSVIAGQVEIGDNVFVGVNTTIVDKINVGHSSLIGAGALITKNIPEFSVMLARSAELLRFNSQEYVQNIGI
jgi:sugar O-acyltransferase (sialic acid O-acetyltransferase NeuD family)